MKIIFPENSKNITLISAIILGISAFLPWAVVEGKASIAGIIFNDGVSGDGIIIFLTAILILLILFSKKVPIAVTFVLGLVGFSISILDFIKIPQAVADIGGKAGYGLYLSIFSALGVILSVLYYWQRKKFQDKVTF